MASAPSITALVSEPVGKPQGELTSSEVLQQGSGGDSVFPEAATDDPALIKPTESKQQDASKPSEQPPAPANGTSNDALVLEAKQEQPNVGLKRDLDVTSSLASVSKAEKPDPEQQQPEELEEPNTKKQKTSEDNNTDVVATNGTSSTPAQNGKHIPASTENKKKGGRPRKARDTIKKDVPTDGIGSRTRSRTKFVS
ncbi:hypothetical protein BJY01DRAFT_25113 [Aspergillus pseudoustus]|uniref:Uncharacterized protein n=1 Tax=Aspergillus pseudoustus TaxID=1810923 RepID=A0ABR4KU86_9EURO